MKRKAHFPGHRPGSLFSLLISLAFFSAAVLFLPSISRSEDSITTDSIGTSPISDNASLARDLAIADALRKAVEQAVGTLVAADTLVENFQVIDDSVYTNSQGYIRNYSIISEARSAEIYEVRVKAVVATGDLSGDLSAMGLLQKKAERPRVLFMMAEKGPAQSDYGYWWSRGEQTSEISATEAALKEAFLVKGFNVVDMPGTGAAGFEGPSGADLTVDGAASIGKALNAEIVVFGKVFVEQGPSTGATSVITYLADMTAQAIRVDDGVVLASSKGRGISRHISTVTGNAEAVSAAAAIVADGLAAQITRRWTLPQTIRITLKGMDYEKAVEFKRFLKTRVRGVEAIYQRRHAGAETSLEVEVKAGAQAVADDIARLGKYRVTGFSAHVIEVEGAQ